SIAKAMNRQLSGRVTTGRPSARFSARRSIVPGEIDTMRMHAASQRRALVSALALTLHAALVEGRLAHDETASIDVGISRKTECKCRTRRAATGPDKMGRERPPQIRALGQVSALRGGSLTPRY